MNSPLTTECRSLRCLPISRILRFGARYTEKSHFCKPQVYLRFFSLAHGIACHRTNFLEAARQVHAVGVKHGGLFDADGNVNSEHVLVSAGGREIRFVGFAGVNSKTHDNLNCPWIQGKLLAKCTEMKAVDDYVNKQRAKIEESINKKKKRKPSEI